ncbi:hypothetical protein LIER_38819 [Lithospermum erythrorhizon]|uniref:RNase H type-1 domain-containing protein n=1 Tax=Lithospermum erythrorhizon TaxID=34254 RepID=A0AAV3Q576_LITER
MLCGSPSRQQTPRLVGYLRRVLKLAKLFRSCHMEQVPRERNKEADRLSQLATEGYETLPEAMMVEWVEEEAFHMKEVMKNNASESQGGSPEPYYQAALHFLRTGTLLGDPLVPNKIQRQA